MKLGSPGTLGDVQKIVLRNSSLGAEARTAFWAQRVNTIATNAYPFLLYSSTTKIVFIKRIFFKVTGTGAVEVFVNPTITTGGTALTPIAMDNDSASPAASATIEHSPTTVGADGTLLYTNTVAAGQEEFSVDFKGNLRFAIDSTATARLLIKGATTTLQVHVEYSEDDI